MAVLNTDGDIATAERRLAALTVPRDAPAERGTPKRERLPEHLPRVEERHELAATDCPACGQGLESIGEEISEQPDIIPAKFFVRRHIRPKYCCRACQRIHTAGLPAQPIDKAIAAAGLLAHVLVSKFADHLPFYRQEEIYARDSVSILRATQALSSFRGVLQVDGYAGYNEVLRREGVIESGCFAHARRKYFDLWQATKSPAAQTAMTQIAKLYQIERDCRETLTVNRTSTP